MLICTGLKLMYNTSTISFYKLRTMFAQWLFTLSYFWEIQANFCKDLLNSV